MLTLLLLINSIRTTPLIESQTLNQMATVRAEQIYISGNFSHEGWGKQFTTTTCGYIGENLAKNFKTDKKAHKALLASPTHKAVMMSPNFKYLGVGKYKNITVELFCDKI